MEPCAVEVGLLKKHPCGHPSVAKCANCEQPLCNKHAIAQLSASGAKTGKFLCAPCNAAAKLYADTEPAPAPAPAQKPAAVTKAPHPAPTPKPAPAPAAKAAPAEKKPEPPAEHSAPLEFTLEPKKPDEKK